MICSKVKKMRRNPLISPTVKFTMKIALISARDNAPSETFIRAHVELLQGEILYYHTGRIPRYLGKQKLPERNSLTHQITGAIKRVFGMTQPSAREKAFEQSLRKTKPDILFAEFGVVGADCMPTARRLNIPLAVHFFGFDASEYKVLEDFKDAYEQMFAYASVIFVVANSMKSKLIELGAPAEKIIVTHCAAHESFAQLQPNLTSKKIYAIGRMIDKKAPHLVILAFKKCLEKHPDATLLFYGNGPMFRIVQDLVNNLDLNQCVKLLGVVEREVYQKEMLDVRFFVQHSRTAENGDMEGTPVAIIEAQSAGLPVVSTRHSGILDIVVHNETGYLVEEGDAVAMAEHMCALLDDMALAKRMGEAGKKRIREHFTMQHHIQTIDKALAAVVANR
jgi:glycosyltransferase involved in cell wall biosynthesis